MDNRRVFSFLKDKLQTGLNGALVTVVSVEGSSMRDPGAHMAVLEDGEFIGSLSGGCIENAVVAEALDVIKECRPRTTRFGSGSSYIDIKLPCGGGLDVHFMPIVDAKVITLCEKSIAQRSPFSLLLPIENNPIAFVAHWQNNHIDPEAGTISVGHWPAPRLAIIGHGAGVISLAKIGNILDMDIDVLTSDPRIVGELANIGLPAKLLKSPKDCAAVKGDPWTAFAFMFHDHDWEAHLVMKALSQPHFYLGAMGGRKAHAHRVQTLQSLGITQQQISMIRAPIGLFHSSRDPDTLATSAIAEIIKAYDQSKFSDIPSVSEQENR